MAKLNALMSDLKMLTISDQNGALGNSSSPMERRRVSRSKRGLLGGMFLPAGALNSPFPIDCKTAMTEPKDSVMVDVKVLDSTSSKI